MTTTPRIVMTEMSASQASKEVTFNEAIRAVDALLQSTVIDKDLTAPPGGEADGDLYIVGGSATGDWSGHDNDIAYFKSTAYVYFTPAEGWETYVQDENKRYRFDGAAWAEVATGGATTFVGLTDTPANFTGSALKVARVNAGETALEFATAGAGDVTGPASSTDGALAQFDGVGGKTLKDGPPLVTTIGNPGADTNVPTEQAVREAITAAGGAGFSRSFFTWKDADEIYIGAGKYFHVGTASQWVYWNSTLTKQLTTAAGVEDFWYLYLDDSAIVSAGTPLLTAAEFIWSTTAPAWDETKKGYYSGLDRCIFAVRVDASNAIEAFRHDGGDYVAEEKFNSVFGPTDVDTTFVDVNFNLPTFSTRVNATFIAIYVTASGGSTVYRPNGSVTATGQVVASATAAGQHNSPHTVFTDTSGIGECKMTSASDSTLQVTQNGWFLPRGM